MIALPAGEAAGYNQPAPVTFKYLHGAKRPAVALRLESFEVGGRESAAAHGIDIAGFVIRVHQPQTEFGILADAPLRPSALHRKRRLADERHRTVLNYRVALVAMMHADAEKP